MKRLGLLVALLLTASTAGAGIRSYEVRLKPGPDGTGEAVAVVRLEGAAPGAIAIPVGFPAIANLELREAPPATTIAARASSGQALVQATLGTGSPADAVLSFAFTVKDAFRAPRPAPGEKATLPAGSLLFKHALMNSQADTIGTYRLVVTFPDGLRAHAVREALPKLRKAESEPRVRLADIDARPGAELRVDGLAQGASTSVQIELASRSRSLGWLAAGLVLSVLYLVRFRDLVAARPR